MQRTELRLNRIHRLSVAGAFLLAVLIAVFPARSINDTHPPEVRSTSPLDNALNVDPTSAVELEIFDPVEFPGIPGSGVDISSIRLWVQGKPVPFFADALIGGGVFVHSNCPEPLPENSWIKVESIAKDNAGNRMSSYIWHFQTRSLPDTTPPVISGFSPPDGIIDVVTTAQVSCEVTDADSGIDLHSVRMRVDGWDVPFSSYVFSGGYVITHQPDKPFTYDSWHTIEVTVKDKAQNSSTTSWHFKTVPEPVYPPELLAPANGSLLNYQLEKGEILFKWALDDSEDQYFRLILRIENYPTMQQIDLGPEDYQVVQKQAIYGIKLSEAWWEQVSDLGDVIWFLYKIDKTGGSPISEKSDIFRFSLASPYVVVLRTPEDNTSFHSSSRVPHFTWDPFAGVNQYVLALARMGSGGDLLDNIHVWYLSPLQIEFTMTVQEWNSLPNGQYIWAVLGKFSSGSDTQTMNFFFTKDDDPFINIPIRITDGK